MTMTKIEFRIKDRNRWEVELSGTTYDIINLAANSLQNEKVLQFFVGVRMLQNNPDFRKISTQDITEKDLEALDKGNQFFAIRKEGKMVWTEVRLKGFAGMEKIREAMEVDPVFTAIINTGMALYYDDIIFKKQADEEE